MVLFLKMLPDCELIPTFNGSFWHVARISDDVIIEQKSKKVFKSVESLIAIYKLCDKFRLTNLSYNLRVPFDHFWSESCGMCKKWLQHKTRVPTELNQAYTKPWNEIYHLMHLFLIFKKEFSIHNTIKWIAFFCLFCKQGIQMGQQQCDIKIFLVKHRKIQCLTVVFLDWETLIIYNISINQFYFTFCA